MARLAADSAERARLGQCGFEDVVEKFNWERVAAACYDALAPTPLAKQIPFPVVAAVPARLASDGSEVVAAPPSNVKLKIVHSA